MLDDLQPLSSPVGRHSSLVHSCVGSMHTTMVHR